MALTRKKKIIIAVSSVAVLAIIIIVSVFASRKEVAEVTTVKLEVKPELRQTVTASGEVRPVRYIKLTSEVPGRIEEIYVNAGDQVVQGKPLVRVDPTQLQTSQEAQFAVRLNSLVTVHPFQEWKVFYVAEITHCNDADRDQERPPIRRFEKYRTACGSGRVKAPFAKRAGGPTVAGGRENRL